MPEIRLRAVSRTQGNNRALKEGAVRPRGVSLDFEEVPVLIQAFRRMVRERAWDVCELAITTYVCARAHGKRITALPVFLVRGLHHGAILQCARAGLGGPKDLEGRRVGVNRGYTVTTGVWARGILQDEHGVDLSKVTWVLSGDEHVAEYRPPANVVPLGPGKDMKDLLVSGELPAAVGVEVEHPEVRPLIAEPLEAGMRALRGRGLWPINHLVVIRDELLEEHPGLAEALFEAFAESKRRYVDALRAGTLGEETETDRLHRRVMDVLGDPLPYGVEPNRAVLEELVRHAVTQRIIDRPVPVEDLFAPATRGLVG
ncbi:MAG TPA: ABC transporter substrate-binding protein [Vicinamibacteria bacterium]|nr:ABC transporter substrate-binding protein [Vicinamibacteria bacterium]